MLRLELLLALASGTSGCTGHDRTPSETSTPREVPTDTSTTTDTIDTTDTPPDTDTIPDTGTPEPCTQVQAVFFDLGDTLVEQSGALFVARPGAAELVTALREADIPIGIITNVPDDWSLQDLRDLLATPSLLDAFDVVLPSSLADAGPKPDPDIFAEAHALLADPPPIEQTAFVTEEIGDIADREVAPTEGARAAGMVGVYLSADGPSPLADHTMDPDDLPAIASAPWLGCERR